MISSVICFHRFFTSAASFTDHSPFPLREREFGNVLPNWLSSCGNQSSSFQLGAWRSSKMSISVHFLLQMFASILSLILIEFLRLC
ncbi:hypothetical protein DEO72_LG5g1229 [Vigna unguiculata]|uniref:Uncharacterized protein n=1 Tax=Vigna unguiculata TaxID=3917 RepID=A0A4D6LXU2_VIGUN|nr:hypothetical protein DEO72_LG5g1229 [Vigna unguiculata]